MSVLTSDERKQAVSLLLTQYRDYQKAESQEEKKRIGDEMFFADPIIWLLYKYEAYQGSNHIISTWGDLVHHSQSHDGICGKRLHWLRWYLKERGFDVLDTTILPKETSLTEVVKMEAIIHLCSDKEAMIGWDEYEFEKINGEVAKWQSYKI